MRKLILIAIFVVTWKTYEASAEEAAIRFDFPVTPGTEVFLTHEKEFIFYEANEKVGTIQWSEGIFTFEGNADKSSKIFLAYLQHHYEDACLGVRQKMEKAK